MKISVAFDHGAVQLRTAILDLLSREGHEVIDHGTNSTDSVDYPDYARLVADDVSSGRSDAGVLCCTTGIGMSIAANKVKGIRASVVHHEDEAVLTRRHNDSNVLCIGALHTDPENAAKLVKAYLDNSFEGGRHDRRVGKFIAWENDSCV
jgi:RpiB/LacA/LacB family sugar-phosphate isomerase